MFAVAVALYIRNSKATTGMDTGNLSSSAFIPATANTAASLDYYSQNSSLATQQMRQRVAAFYEAWGIQNKDIPSICNKYQNNVAGLNEILRRQYKGTDLDTSLAVVKQTKQAHVKKAADLVFSAKPSAVKFPSPAPVQAVDPHQYPMQPMEARGSAPPNSGGLRTTGGTSSLAALEAAARGRPANEGNQGYKV